MRWLVSIVQVRTIRNEIYNCLNKLAETKGLSGTDSFKETLAKVIHGNGYAKVPYACANIVPQLKSVIKEMDDPYLIDYVKGTFKQTKGILRMSPIEAENLMDKLVDVTEEYFLSLNKLTPEELNKYNEIRRNFLIKTKQIEETDYENLY